MQKETRLLKKKAKKQNKTEDGENLFFTDLAFGKHHKICSWFNKVVHGRPCIKWTS